MHMSIQERSTNTHDPTEQVKRLSWTTHLGAQACVRVMERPCQTCFQMVSIEITLLSRIEGLQNEKDKTKRGSNNFKIANPCFCSTYLRAG
eukprot:379876-Amphidinium_carterae.1